MGELPTNLLALGVFLGVFGAVLVRQLLDRGPPVWSLFALGALGTVATGLLTPELAAGAVWGSASVLVFLLSLFLFARALQDAGALAHLARWLVGLAPRAEELPVVLFLGFGLAAAFLVNDALVVIGVPVLLAVALRLRVPARPLLLTLAFAVTVGSALTPFGNPQNLLVAAASGLRAPVATFLRYLLVPTAANLVVGAYYLRWRFRRELQGGTGAPAAPEARIRLLPTGGWGPRLRREPVLAIFPATVAALIGFGVASSVVPIAEVPDWLIAGVGAVALLAVSPSRSTVLRRVNWEILVLFAGLFVVVAGVVHGGLVRAVEAHVALPGPAHPIEGLATIVGTSLVGPQLVSNVPWVGIEIPTLIAAGYSSSTPIAWVGLAAASTLAGNVTLLGAASNLIVADLGERAGVRIGLRTFVRDALPIAAISLGILFACLVVGV